MEVLRSTIPDGNANGEKESGSTQKEVSLAPRLKATRKRSIERRGLPYSWSKRHPGSHRLSERCSGLGDASQRPENATA
jgi:hypothetical protein